MTSTTLLQAKALYANNADNEEELSFEAGEVLTVVERDVAGLVGWWLCSHAGRIGIAPGNRLRLLSAAAVNSAASSISGSSQDRRQTDAGKNDSSSTAKPRPSTAPLHGHNTQIVNNSKNALVVPHKSGNVYVYNGGVDQCVDYDVPPARHTIQPTHNTPISAARPVSTQDYDVPIAGSVKSACCNDIEFGDYDLLSPAHHRPPSDVDCSISSNRSSVTSVLSAGSLSSGCGSSVRSAQSPVGSVVGARSSAAVVPRTTYCYDVRPMDQSAGGRCVSETTSDSSADSGIALQTALNWPTSRPNVDGGLCRRNDTTCDDDCLDYDIPVMSVNGDDGRPLDVVQELQPASHHQQQSQTSWSRPVINGHLLQRRNDDAEAVRRRRHVDDMRDCVMRSVQRFLAWTGLVTGDTGRDVAVTRQYYGQAKLAGLAVRTSLKELIGVADEQSLELLRSYIEPLNGSLYEIDRRLDCLIASGSDVHPSRLATSQRSPASCRDQLLAVAEVVADLPDHVKQFADFVTTNASVAIRLQDDVDVMQPSSSVVSKVSSPPPPPAPPQRKDSHYRDRPPLSPSAVTSPARSRRPPLGKPPPVKPKPPKSVTWKRPPLTAAEPQRPGWTSRVSTPPVNAPVISRSNESSYERRVAELNKTNKSSTDGWNDDDCDYVSIVRQVEREMESMAAPINKDATTRIGEATSNTSSSARLNDDDRELVEFYATQISNQAADVDAAAAEFYRCCCSSTMSSVDAFVRRSRFVVLAAHRLVYVGDVIARHVTDESVRDQVAEVANSLCDGLKAVVVATRLAALAMADADCVKSAGVRQTVVNSVRKATENSRRLCDVISVIACQ